MRSDAVARAKQGAGILEQAAKHQAHRKQLEKACLPP